MNEEQIYKERRRRFALLLEHYSNQAAAAEALGLVSAAAVSNYKKRKNMGEVIARRVERESGLPAGSFTDPVNTPWPDSAVLSQLLARTLNTGISDSDIVMPSFKQGHLNVQSYELWSGEIDTEIRSMSVPTMWLKAEGYDVDQIKSIRMPDDSQSGFIGKGFDIAVNVDWGGKVINNMFYAIKIGGTVTLRKIEIQYNNDLLLRCLNSDYTDQKVPADEIDTLDIVGIAVRYQADFPKPG